MYNLQPAYLFLCPLEHLQSGDAMRFQLPIQYAYWSLHPTGDNHLSDKEAEILGLPTLSVTMNIWGRSCDAKVYAGMRQFHEGKGFKSNTRDVAQYLELVEVEDFVRHLSTMDGRTSPRVQELFPNNSGSNIDQSTASEIPPETMKVHREPKTKKLYSPSVNQLLWVLGISRSTSVPEPADNCAQFTFPQFSLPIFQQSDRSIIASALKRAENLESWLDDESLAVLIDILGSDIAEASTYNSLQRASLRIQWVRRKLAQNGKHFQR
ncbi:hypothetical protein B0H19DRAFT_1082644 [Mycena capillaripes]|nr:hypothetical protein B0H19DRAFT_1082644 [Mycena capillaripes]